MGLTWRDLVSSVAISAMVLAWAVLYLGASVPLFSSAWATSPLLLILAAICAVTAAGDLHTRPQPRLGVIFRKATTVLGSVALVAGIGGMIADSGYALEILVVAMILLYATGTVWHVLTFGAPQ